VPNQREMQPETPITADAESKKTDSKVMSKTDATPSYLNIEQVAQDKLGMSGDCGTKRAHCGNHYKTEPRTRVDFRSICMYLKSKEISCQKYNYSLASLVQN
jgi:hypothetical protein